MPTRRSTPLALLTAVSLGLAALLSAPSARADASAWFHAGGGVLGWKGGADAELVLSPLMAYDLGVGTDDRADYIFGGYFRVQPVLDGGADVALFARFATNGFQSSWVGFALDAGAYQRWWGVESTGFIGQAVLGGPFGLQLSALGMVGSGDTYGFGGVLGVDLARLTTHRRHLLDWWTNPRPDDAYASRR